MFKANRMDHAPSRGGMTNERCGVSMSGPLKVNTTDHAPSEGMSMSEPFKANRTDHAQPEEGVKEVKRV